MTAMLHLFIPVLVVMHFAEGIHILDLLRDYGLTNSYGIKVEPLPRFNEYDFIVVGSGPGGSSVASRLSENKSWRVLLLEAGKPEGILHQVPMLGGLFLNSEYDWNYRVEPQKKACLGIEDHRCSYPKGKSLGGSTSINGMVYSRGNKLDFDIWADQGNYGWSYEEVLPFFKKSERAKLQEPVDQLYHGKNGNVHVQSAPWRTAVATAFVKSGNQLGYDIIDYNGQNHVGFSYSQCTMLNGARCSASKAYLRVKRSNLDIVTEAMVSRVLISSKNEAYGVEFIKNNRSYRVHSRKEVILSAGAMNTPKLLMLSGIGPKEHLRELGIKVVKNLAVGHNLNDHVGYVGLTFLVNDSITLITTNMQTPKAALEYAIKGSGPYSVPGLNEAVAFIRTKYANDSRPDLEFILRTGTFNMDTDESARKERFISKSVYDVVWKPLIGKNAFTMWPAVQLSRSKGYVKLRSTNPEDPPIIDPNLLDEQYDVDILLEGIKIAIALSKTEAFQKYGTKLHDTRIPGCESLQFGSDDYWRCTIRQLTIGFNHDMGTARMGPATDSSAVVDPELRVHGVKNLRVSDTSIMPELPVGHLSATTYMIGEKAADMIKKSWKN